MNVVFALGVFYICYQLTVQSRNKRTIHRLRERTEILEATIKHFRDGKKEEKTGKTIAAHASNGGKDSRFDTG